MYGNERNKINGMKFSIFHQICCKFRLCTVLHPIFFHFIGKIRNRYTHSHFYIYRETKQHFAWINDPIYRDIRTKRNGAVAAAATCRNMVHICCQSLNHTKFSCSEIYSWLSINDFPKQTNNHLIPTSAP